MTASKSDIDIDVPDRENALLALGNPTKASMISNGVIKPHLVGVYFQQIPTFMGLNISSIDYKKAPEYGYFKVDILNNSVYEEVKSEEHLDRLLNTEPDWSMLQDYNVVKTLFQIHKYSSQLEKWKPSTVIQLAMFIAMIRPSKKHLMDCNTWYEVEKEIWEAPIDDSPYFKKSHAIAYASAIVIQLNLISGM